MSNPTLKQHVDFEGMEGGVDPSIARARPVQESFVNRGLVLEPALRSWGPGVVVTVEKIMVPRAVCKPVCAYPVVGRIPFAHCY
jgi:hypothetical protein